MLRDLWEKTHNKIYCAAITFFEVKQIHYVLSALLPQVVGNTNSLSIPDLHA